MNKPLKRSIISTDQGKLSSWRNGPPKLLKQRKLDGKVSVRGAPRYVSWIYTIVRGSLYMKTSPVGSRAAGNLCSKLIIPFYFAQNNEFDTLYFH